MTSLDGNKTKVIFLLLLLLGLIIPQGESFSYQLTGEAVLFGVGTIDYPLNSVTETNGSFCFFAEGQAWGGSSEDCGLVQGNYGQWTMHKESQVTQYICGTTCVMTFGSAKLSENKQYTGEGTEDHTFEDVSFCYLTSGRNWNGGDESCHVLQDSSSNSSWSFQKTSSQSQFDCSAQCVTITDTTVNQQKEVIFLGTGSQSISLGLSESQGFCFITYGASWTSGSERCSVVNNYGQWYLTAESHQPSFKCGVTCVSFSS